LEEKKAPQNSITQKQIISSNVGSEVFPGQLDMAKKDLKV
jgi:hypothetical protein